MADTPRKPSLDTLAIHAGQEPDPVHAAVMQPIVLSSTFAQPAPGKPVRYEYSRSGNPTREALEKCLSVLASEVRMTVLLRFQSGMSYPDMSEVLGVRSETLQARVARALPVLRRCLEGKGWQDD